MQYPYLRATFLKAEADPGFSLELASSTPISLPALPNDPPDEPSATGRCDREGQVDSEHSDPVNSCCAWLEYSG